MPIATQVPQTHPTRAGLEAAEFLPGFFGWVPIAVDPETGGFEVEADFDPAVGLPANAVQGKVYRSTGSATFTGAGGEKTTLSPGDLIAARVDNASTSDFDQWQFAFNETQFKGVFRGESPPLTTDYDVNDTIIYIDSSAAPDLNFQLLRLVDEGGIIAWEAIPVFQVISNLEFEASLFDCDQGNGFFYFGGTIGSNWEIRRRLDRNGFDLLTATESNNPAITDLTTAWNNRLTLTYS